jgi:hypothetical protein
VSLDRVSPIRLVPYAGYAPGPLAPPPRPRPGASSPGAATSSDGEVEVSIRVFAEGGSVTVMRRTALEPDGVTRRTVGIEAVIR